MPTFQAGDLVQVKEVGDDAVGLILEMRPGIMQPEAYVMWNDMPAPRWIHLSSLVTLQRVSDIEHVLE